MGVTKSEHGYLILRVANQLTDGRYEGEFGTDQPSVLESGAHISLQVRSPICDLGTTRSERGPVDTVTLVEKCIGTASLS